MGGIYRIGNAGSNKIMKDVLETRRENLKLIINTRFGGVGVRMAEAMGWEKPALIYQLSSTNRPKPMGEKLARRIEKVAGKPDFWMEYEHFDEANEAFKETSFKSSELTLGPDFQKKVPVVSWVTAGKWCETDPALLASQAEEWVAVTKRLGDRSYGLRVQGDSMEPKFQDGCIIVVDPDSEVKNGSFVVIQLLETNEAPFKQWVIEGSRRYLKPLNTRYPILEVTGEARICGVVRTMMMDFD